MAGIVVAILREIGSEGPVSPGDAAARLGLPRYKVLAAFHVLEELGLIERVYSKGSYRIYSLTLAGRKLLEAVARGASPASIVESAILAAAEPGEVRGVPGSEVGVDGEAQVEAG